jgi:hypothetical protein
MADSDNDNEDKPEKVDESRRRLMRMAIYAPPTIIGIIELTNAGCAPVSCPPSECSPNGQCAPTTCNPVINPCAPQSCNPATCNPNS